uniref:Lysm-containing receptor kinase 21 n=1 Tax=Parasponia rugosa TaxID=1603294 RepID=A0A221I0J8_9ROSA|nr:lysm-containing receptor kinase 21 [Parasponia rugosa]
MRTKPHYSSPLLLLFFFFFLFILHSNAQPGNIGYNCTINQTTSPCQTYVFYRAIAPDFLDLASIADLFSVSRLMISNPSNITSPSSPLVPNQPLFIPITCSCNSVNNGTITAISYANLSYTIKKGDTFFMVSTQSFQNLTTYQSVELVNPTLVPENLTIGVNVVFPIFCKCPNKTQMGNQANHLISYVFRPSDNISTVATTFGIKPESINAVNGDKIQPFQTIFIPVTRLPVLSQPTVVPSPPPGNDNRKGVVTGLGIGLGITGFLLVLVCGFWLYREKSLKKMRVSWVDEEKRRVEINKGVEWNKGYSNKEMEESLMADVSGCLDKYRVFGVDELEEATNGFHENCLIQGSVYKGCIDGEVYAIKKMNWNACEELKILQMVNHGNLVKLEGFCIDPLNANCYLIYEYVEYGSLDLWLHENENENGKLNWKTRLRIAVDVANGLQYIHEHTRPRVVHKDIKSSNILLDANMRAKIANFGLAKSGCNAITMHIVGTQGYIAPEYLTDGMVSTKMDVFSFGVVLLELISGKGAVDEEGIVLWARATQILQGSEEQKAKKLKEWTDPALREESYLMESIMNVMSVAVACLHRDPSKRPSMVDIVYALCKSDDSFTDISDDTLSDSQVFAR